MTAATAQRPAIEYTDAQLRAAWRVCKLSTWPLTFEEAMADAQRSRLVRLHACRLARRPGTRYAFTVRRLPEGFVDVKRAAAGDRDD